MATFLRTWSYRYPWLYDGITQMMALAVGGEARLRRLPLQGVSLLPSQSVLDLCCGHGAVTKVLVQYSEQVTGLDASPKAIARARAQVPQATFVEGFAEAMPFPDESFEIVHTSLALHEMEPEVGDRILQEIYRVLKPNGLLMLVDLHQPSNPVLWPGLALFLWLFEPDSAWQLLRTDLGEKLTRQGFRLEQARYPAGGSLQVLHARKP